MAHAGRKLPGSSAPSRRNSMTDTDLHQPDPGPLRAAAEAAELAQAVIGLVSIDGCRLADSDPLADCSRLKLVIGRPLLEVASYSPVKRNSACQGSSIWTICQ
jgi:hypothetical protein